MTFSILWNPDKRVANLAKHGLDFVDAVMVLDSPFRLDVEHVRGGEFRLQSFAYVFEVLTVLTVLTVVHVTRGQTLRIISFRPASEEERDVYHDWLENDYDNTPRDAGGH